MSNLSAEFGDFSGTTKDTFSINVPENRQFGTKVRAFASDIKEFKGVTDTMSNIRIIAWPDSKYFAKQVILHQGLGAEKHAVPCPKMLGEDKHCPLCLASKQAYAAGQNDVGKLFSAKTRHLMWVIDRAHPEFGPQIMNLPDQTVNAIRNLMIDPRTNAVMPIEDLDNGYDVFFKRRKETPSSPFLTINDLQCDKSPTPLGTVEQARPWLLFIRSHPIAQVLEWQKPEKMELLAGLVTPGQVGDNDDGFAEEPAQEQASAQPDPLAGLPSASQAAQMSTPLQQTQQASAQPTLNELAQAPVQAAPPAPAPAPAAPSLGFDVNELEAKLLKKAEQQ